MKKAICKLLLMILLCLCFATTAFADTIVIYFSCTGTTEKAANWIAEDSGAELYRLLPEEPYTQEDLEYYTDCRADREQGDDAARPAIANMPVSLSDYDVIFLGYPIWHGKAPKIMYTFLESFDMAGKTVIPFCTSHSSPMGSSAVLLQSLTAETTTWQEGRRFSRDAEHSEITDWMQSLDLPVWSKTIYITVDNTTMKATLSDNPSAKAFYEQLLTYGDLVIAMEDYGNFEKVGPLGTRIVQSDEKINTVPGDIILYQGDKVTIYYAENTWTFTKLGHIDGTTAENMKEFLGSGNPTVRFSLKNMPSVLPVTDGISDVLMLPEDLTVLEEESLRGTNPQMIIVPESVKEIRSKAFSDCKRLVYLQLPGGEISLAEDMLDGCNDVVIVCCEGSPADVWAKGKGFVTRHP